MGSWDWLQRYRRGEREKVWHELRQLGATVSDAEAAGEAQAVCDEMALRARHNVEVIIDRLTTQGFRFHTNDDAQDPVVPFHGSSSGAGAQLRWLEERVGPVPMTVSSWLRLVGDVWLVGTHPRWEASAEADPLVIEIEGLRWPGKSMQDYFAEEFEQWNEGVAEGESAGVFVLPVAPDRLHKANISGGPPYGFTLPDACADALFLGEVAMPFVAYLNWVFQNGGFPGVSQGNQQWQVKRSLSEGLLPL